jgi:hypothetical protein
MMWGMSDLQRAHRRAMRAEQRDQRAHMRAEAQWKPWFAWYPVQMVNARWVWWEPVLWAPWRENIVPDWADFNLGFPLFSVTDINKMALRR